MLVYYFVPFIVSNLYLLFWVSNGHNSVTVQNRTHVYMNFFHHKDLGNHLRQLCPKVVKHPVYKFTTTKNIVIVFLPGQMIQADWKRNHTHERARLLSCTWKEKSSNSTGTQNNLTELFPYFPALTHAYATMESLLIHFGSMPTATQSLDAVQSKSVSPKLYCSQTRFLSKNNHGSSHPCSRK